MTESKERMVGAAADGDVNLRADSYFVALTVVDCRHCGLPTRLVALVLPPTHQSAALDVIRDREQESFQDSWETAGCTAFLFFVERLSSSTQRRLLEIAPAYRYGGGDTQLGPYWSNHCEHCDSWLDDHELFCEPEGAFLPTSPTAAAAIDLLRIDEQIEAAAAGCAPEPQFLSCMREV